MPSARKPKRITNRASFDKAALTEILSTLYPQGSNALKAGTSKVWNALISECVRQGIHAKICSTCHEQEGTCECVHHWNVWADQQSIPMPVFLACRPRLLYGDSMLSAEMKRKLTLVFDELDAIGRGKPSPIRPPELPKDKPRSNIAHLRVPPPGYLLSESRERQRRLQAGA